MKGRRNVRHRPVPFPLQDWLVGHVNNYWILILDFSNSFSISLFRLIHVRLPCLIPFWAFVSWELRSGEHSQRGAPLASSIRWCLSDGGAPRRSAVFIYHFLLNKEKHIHPHPFAIGSSYVIILCVQLATVASLVFRGCLHVEMIDVPMTARVPGQPLNVSRKAPPCIRGCQGNERFPFSTRPLTNMFL